MRKVQPACFCLEKMLGQMENLMADCLRDDQGQGGNHEHNC